MVFRETIALGKVFLSREMLGEMKDVLLLNYRDIPAANDRLRRMNGTAGEYYTFCSNTSHPISYDGDRLAEEIQIVAKATGRDVEVFGHSRGALIARHAAQKAGAAQYMSSLTLFAGPNNGTHPNIFNPLEEYKLRIKPRYVLDDMEPGSDYLKDLNALPPPGIPVYNMYTIDGSDFMVPPESAHLDWAKNIELEGVRHSNYLADQEVADFVAEVYPPNTPVIYVHGLRNLFSIMLEGTVLYPLSAAFVFPWLPVEERYVAQNGFRPIHSAIAETGKMNAQLKAVA